MSLLFPRPPASLSALAPSWLDQPIVYLALAALCLVLALRFLKRAVAPIGALIQAAAAAAVVAFAAVLALAMVVIAVLASAS